MKRRNRQPLLNPIALTQLYWRRLAFAALLRGTEKRKAKARSLTTGH